MKIGDLVKKTGGYGSELKDPMIGIIIDFICELETNRHRKVVVLSPDGFEHWMINFVTKISQDSKNSKNIRFS